MSDSTDNENEVQPSNVNDSNSDSYNTMSINNENIMENTPIFEINKEVDESNRLSFDELPTSEPKDTEADSNHVTAPISDKIENTENSEIQPANEYSSEIQQSTENDYNSDSSITKQLYNAASNLQHSASRKDDDDRKIFVGGLHWETKIEDLREYFATYGEILDVTLKTDISTGRSRGFGFVLFDDVQSVEKVMQQTSHVLHGKTIDPKRAVTRVNGSNGSILTKDPCKKIFVGGISPDMPEGDIKNFFSKYGKIEEVELPFDRVKNMRRAYVFITFETEKCAEDACVLAKQKIGEREVDVRKATPRSEHAANKVAGVDMQGMYPPGYDYSQYYANYGYGYPGYPGMPAYDYSQYYNQDWSQYAAQYGQGYAYPQGYDYSAWYAAQGQAQPAANAGQVAGKVKRDNATPAYHPYTR